MWHARKTSHLLGVPKSTPCLD